MKEPLKIGLLLNPVAGVGGSLAMKGSDGEEARQVAAGELEHGSSRCAERAQRALERLTAVRELLLIHCWAGPMGGDLLRSSGLPYVVHGEIAGSMSLADDTRRAASGLVAQGIDLLVFADQTVEFDILV